MYAGQNSYGSITKSSKTNIGSFRCIIKAALKPGSYTEHFHTLGNSYKLKNDEPDLLEYRVGKVIINN